MDSAESVVNPKFDGSRRYKIEIIFPADLQYVGVTRRRLEEIFEREWEIPLTDSVKAFSLAVGEAMANAVKHGKSKTRVTACYNPVTSIITVEVADQGGGFDYTAPIPTPNDHGFGLGLMAAGCDSFGYCRRDGWFCCTLIKQF